MKLKKSGPSTDTTPNNLYTCGMLSRQKPLDQMTDGSDKIFLHIYDPFRRRKTAEPSSSATTASHCFLVTICLL